MPGTPSDRCTYFRSHCADADEGAAFPYSGWYYCGAALFPLAPLAQLLYVLSLLACLPLFFALLGDTAERYFSPIMACVAQSIPKMRPRFAGVTFVALGNGAPDLSSNASAIRSGEYLLAAGAITGGAMFVQCVVGAQVVSIASEQQRQQQQRGRRGAGRGTAGGGEAAGGVRCAGAMLRDAGVFSVAVLSLALALHSGSVGKGYVAWSVALYAVYVAWVFAGDEWHAAGRPDTDQVRRSLLSLRERVAAGLEGVAAGGARGGGGGGRRRQQQQQPLFDGAGLDEDEPAFLLPASAVGAAAAADAAPWASAAADADAGLAAPPGLGSGSAASPRRAAAAAAASRGQNHHHGHHNHHHHPSSRYVDPLTYRQLVWADLAEEGGGAEAEAIGAGAAQRELRRQERRRQRRQGREERRRRQMQLGGQEEEEEEEEEEATLLTSSSAAAAAAGQEGDAGRTQGAALPPPPAFPPTSLPALRRLLFGADAPPPTPAFSSPAAPFFTRLHAWLPKDWSARLYARCRRAASHGASDEWDDPATTPPLQRFFRAYTLPMLLSTYLTQRLTIPLADPGPGYSRGWLLASVVGFPLWMAAYLVGWAAAPWWVWPAALGVGVASSYGLAAYTSRSPSTPPALPMPPEEAGGGGAGEEELEEEEEEEEGGRGGGGAAAAAAARAPRRLSSSSSSGASSSSSLLLPPPSPPGPPWLRRAVPATLALAGFAAGVTWIDAVASQAVAVLALCAALARLPQGVVGLTLLAWGNSLGDYFGNSALARAGAGSTAITACFAGPLFNVLISMALGFTARFSKLSRQMQEEEEQGGGGGGGFGGGGIGGGGANAPTTTTSVPVQLTPEVALGCGCLVLYSATAVAVGRACGGRLPPWFAAVGRGFYACYFCAAVWLGLRGGGGGGGGGGG
jgi:Ca2+/Na+ antiporter